MYPCEQEQNIAHISKTLDRMERSQERVVELLERVATQDARINSLEEHSEYCRRSADIIFERLRDLELNQASSGPAHREHVRECLDSLETSIESFTKKLDKINRFFYLTTHRWALTIYGVILAAIVAGTVMDFIYHMEFIKKIYYLIRG